MTFQLSQQSLDRLNGVHPDLQKVVKQAIELSTVDFKVVEGVRSDEQCYINWGKGRTASECSAHGVPTKYAQPKLGKVTWLNNPLSSNHRKKADGYGHAVDLLPAPYDWKELAPFDAVKNTMFAAAKELGVKLRWGSDWNCNGKPREHGETDNPHFEI